MTWSDMKKFVTEQNHPSGKMVGLITFTSFFFKAKAFLVGPMAFCQKTHEFPHRSVGQPKRSDKVSGHTARS